MHGGPTTIGWGYLRGPNKFRFCQPIFIIKTAIEFGKTAHKKQWQGIYIEPLILGYDWSGTDANFICMYTGTRDCIIRNLLVIHLLLIAFLFRKYEG